MYIDLVITKDGKGLKKLYQCPAWSKLRAGEKVIGNTGQVETVISSVTNSLTAETMPFIKIAFGYTEDENICKLAGVFQNFEYAEDKEDGSEADE